eukprot:1135195-Prymnesium_polylepis.1
MARCLTRRPARPRRDADGRASPPSPHGECAVGGLLADSVRPWVGGRGRAANPTARAASLSPPTHPDQTVSPSRDTFRLSSSTAKDGAMLSFTARVSVCS